MTAGLSIRSYKVATATIAMFAVLVLLPAVSVACPLCDIPHITLTEQLGAADAAVLVQWVGGVKDLEEKPGSTTYQIQRVVKGPKSLAKDQKITLERYQAGKVGDLFLVLATDFGEGQGIEWVSALEVSETSFNYIVQAPSRETVAEKRLAYFVKFLESPDSIIANDAFGEIASAEYQDLEKFSARLPIAKLRAWIVNPDIPETRLGLYGLLLGLCGTRDDAKVLEAKILVQAKEFRLGIDGMMGGYLLILKDKGLDVLDKHKLADQNAAFSETFAAMQALRFMWTYAKGKIAPERLQQSMRIILGRPEMADLAISDLARWKDWSLQDKLMARYGQGDYNVPSIKRAIIRYMMVSTKDVAAVGKPQAARVAHGHKLLADLRKKDPQTVADTERFFPVR